MALHEPGIYFGLPEEEYHADPAFSSSGVRDILVSPLTYWINSARNDEAEDTETASMLAGSATHKYVIEGPEAFHAAYAIKPDQADHPGALVTTDDLKRWLKGREEKVTGSKPELTARVRELDQHVELWSEIMAAFEDAAEGKIKIAADVAEQIRARGELILSNSSLRAAFNGGYPEVSIFWLDPLTGIRMKCRVDYLKVGALVELKTFNNMYNRPVDAAIAQAVANYRYHVGAAIYLEGVEQAKAMLRKGGMAATVRLGEIPNDWLRAFASGKQHAMVFVFIEQGKVPNVRLREFARTGPEGPALAYQSGLASFRVGVDTFVRCIEHFGDKPWIDDDPVRPFVDEEFPLWMMN